MARPKAFDRDEVLTRAMDLFWEKGFESASMQDLVEHMGIGRASLYDTFGSKQELFAEAMALYTARVREGLLAPLRADGPARDVIGSFFRGLVDAHCEESNTCLVVKSALVTGQEDPGIRAVVDEHFKQVEQMFFDVLRRDYEQPRALARFFVAGLQGLAVTASVRRDRRALRDVVRGITAVLD